VSKLNLIKEFFTVVRHGRRITLPSEFKEGEPVKIRIERIVAIEGERGIEQD